MTFISEQIISKHSTLSKDLIKIQPPWMGPSQGERTLLGGPDYGFRKILANGAGQEKLKN